MFKGFSFKLPEYTVITPQSGESYNIRSLNVAEVDKLKTSLVTPNKAHSLINNLLWDAVQNKPTHIKTALEFKTSVTTSDREALLYGLYQATFGDDRDFHVRCQSCEHEQMVKIKLTKIFSMNAYPYSTSLKESYKIARTLDDAPTDLEIEASIKKDEKPSKVDKPISESAVVISDEDQAKQHAMGGFNHQLDDDGDGGILLGDSKSIEPKEPLIQPNSEVADASVDTNGDDILIRRIRLELPISKVICYIRQPTMRDEEDTLTSLAFISKKQGEIVNETLIIDRFEQYNEGDKVPHNVISEREDILWGYRSLSIRDKQVIFDEFHKEFGQYKITLASRFECSKCEFDNELDVGITMQFFRMVGIS